MSSVASSISKSANGDSGLEIRLDDITVNALSDHPILSNISLEVKKGDIVAVLGQSGAGKSTLLRTMAGLIEPSKNRILFNDTSLVSLKKKDRLLLRRKIGYIPQQFKLIKELSVFENVMIGRLWFLGTIRSILRRYPERDKKIVANCISKVGLTDKQPTPAKRLSGGEQQRVAIARCLAQEPSIILADEPMASLDISLAETILDILNNENQNGKTVVFVIHDIEMAFKYAKRIVLVKDGQITFDRPCKEFDYNTVKAFFN